MMNKMPRAKSQVKSASRTTRKPAARTARGLVAVSVPSFDSLDFAGHLASLIEGASRGERTRLKLLACGLHLLADTSFRDLNVDDVVGKAEIAKGTFYIHFPSKDAFLVELARRYVAFEKGSALPRKEKATAFARVYDWLAWYEEIFARNVGVVRCLVQASETNDEMRELWHARNATLTDLCLSTSLPHSSPADPALARLALRVSGGMIDQSLFERHRVQVGPGRREPDDDRLRLELHALLSYRAIYGRNPPAEELERTRSLLDWPGS